MYLGENNDNLSKTKNMFSLSACFSALPENKKIFAETGNFVKNGDSDTSVFL